MSDAFEKLSRSMASAANLQLTLVIDAFNSFRHHDPDLPQQRDQYEAFLYEYVHNRIGDAIRRKVGSSSPTASKLCNIISRISAYPLSADYHILENQISMDVFGSKSRLMMDFRERIEDLSKAIRASLAESSNENCSIARSDSGAVIVTLVERFAGAAGLAVI
ncbi:MAG: hypothetical protein ACR2OZ_07045 [Verrucomicrobiales bacterium]